MRILASILLLAAVSAEASFIRLAWDASVTPGCEYVLYASTNELTQETYRDATVRVPCGTNLTATIEGIVVGELSFAATAVKDGAESDLSNVVVTEIPPAPGTMRTVVVQYGGTVTNWQELDFFECC